MSKKATRKVSLPLPSSVAAGLVDNIIRGAADWNSDFIWMMFIEGPDGNSGHTTICNAVKAQRKAEEAVGNRGVTAEADNQDEVEGAFHLGYALGAKFGGLR